MNAIIGTLWVALTIMLIFFGLPLSGIFLLGLISPAPVIPLMKPEPIIPTDIPLISPTEIPIYIKKVIHRGNYIWVDA